MILRKFLLSVHWSANVKPDIIETIQCSSVPVTTTRAWRILKELCHDYLIHVYNANHTSLLAMELEKLLWTAKLQLRVKPICHPSITLQTTKMKCSINKFSKTTIVIRLHLPIRFSLVYLLCYSNLCFMFWAVIFMFHSVG